MPVLLLTPAGGLVLLLAGILAIYCELIWPGRVVFGLAGSAGVMTGAYVMWRNSPTSLGLTLLTLAVAGFLIETVSKADWVAGGLGTAALAAAGCLLFRGTGRISPALALTVCLGFGGVTSLLAYAGKRARRRKWADV